MLIGQVLRFSFGFVTLFCFLLRPFHRQDGETFIVILVLASCSQNR